MTLAGRRLTESELAPQGPGEMKMTTETIHAFEQAGLGKAPFRYIGMEHQDISYGMAVVGHAGGIPITTKPGGTCAFCGTYIVNMFGVESADGNRFHVGCECIRKTGDAGMMKLVDRDEKARKKLQREASEKNRKAAARLLCETGLNAVAAKLSEQKHPNAYHSAEGLTMFDYVKWMVENKCFTSAAKIIKANQ